MATTADVFADSPSSGEEDIPRTFSKNPTAADIQVLARRSAMLSASYQRLRKEKADLKTRLRQCQAKSNAFNGQIDCHLKDVCRTETVMHARIDALVAEKSDLQRRATQFESENNEMTEQIQEKAEEHTVTERRIQKLMDRLVVLLSQGSSPDAAHGQFTEVLEELAASEERLLRHQQSLTKQLEAARTENRQAALRLSDECRRTKHLHDTLCSLQAELFSRHERAPVRSQVPCPGQTTQARGPKRRPAETAGSQLQQGPAAAPSAHGMTLAGSAQHVGTDQADSGPMLTDVVGTSDAPRDAPPPRERPSDASTGARPANAELPPQASRERLMAIEEQLRIALEDAHFEQLVVRLSYGLYQFGTDIRARVELKSDGKAYASFEEADECEPLDTFIPKVAVLCPPLDEGTPEPDIVAPPTAQQSAPPPAPAVRKQECPAPSPAAAPEAKRFSVPPKAVAAAKAVCANMLDPTFTLPRGNRGADQVSKTTVPKGAAASSTSTANPAAVGGSATVPVAETETASATPAASGAATGVTPPAPASRPEASPAQGFAMPKLPAKPDSWADATAAASDAVRGAAPAVATSKREASAAPGYGLHKLFTKLNRADTTSAASGATQSAPPPASAPKREGSPAPGPAISKFSAVPESRVPPTSSMAMPKGIAHGLTPAGNAGVASRTPRTWSPPPQSSNLGDAVPQATSMAMPKGGAHGPTPAGNAGVASRPSRTWSPPPQPAVGHGRAVPTPTTIAATNALSAQLRVQSPRTARPIPQTGPGDDGVAQRSAPYLRTHGVAGGSMTIAVCGGQGPTPGPILPHTSTAPPPAMRRSPPVRAASPDLGSRSGASLGLSATSVGGGGSGSGVFNANTGSGNFGTSSQGSGNYGSANYGSANYGSANYGNSNNGSGNYTNGPCTHGGSGNYAPGAMSPLRGVVGLAGLGSSGGASPSRVGRAPPMAPPTGAQPAFTRVVTANAGGHVVPMQGGVPPQSHATPQWATSPRGPAQTQQPPGAPYGPGGPWQLARGGAPLLR